MPTSDWLDITDRTLNAVDGLTDEQMAVVLSGLDSSFSQVSRDMVRLYGRLEGADPRYIQTELAKLKKLNMSRQLLSPEQADEFESVMAELLAKQTENGIAYADLMRDALANPPELVQQFGEIDLEAAAVVARDSRKRLEKHSQGAAEKIIALTTESILQGKGATRLARDIQGQLGLTKARAVNIARTETMSALNTATQKRYKDYGAEYVQIIALVDRRTTIWCRARHLKIIKITDSQPPYHFQCRTVVAPVDPAWIDKDDLKWMQEEMARAKKTGAMSLNRAPFEAMNRTEKPDFISPEQFAAKPF